MGVKGLWKLLDPAARPVTLESLEGKILAIDVSIWLNKAAKGMRDSFGNPVHNAHLVLVFNRICKLLFYNIKPIFVFDGGVPELKKRTLAARREARFSAAKKSKKTSEKLLKNYLKRKAMQTVAGTSKPRPLPKKPTTKEEDLFSLPARVPLENIKQSSSSEDEETDIQEEWLQQMASSNVTEILEDTDSIDFTSSAFKSLPSEIQHEILMEMKFSHRHRHFKMSAAPMPEDSGDFSSFQLGNLLKRGRITRRIDDLRQTMNAQHSGEIADKYSKLEDGIIRNVESRRIASDDKQHYILVKNQSIKKTNELFCSGIDDHINETKNNITNHPSFQRLERQPAKFIEGGFVGFNEFMTVSDSSTSESDDEFSRSIIGEVDNESQMTESKPKKADDEFSCSIIGDIDNESQMIASKLKQADNGFPHSIIDEIDNELQMTASMLKQADIYSGQSFSAKSKSSDNVESASNNTLMPHAVGIDKDNVVSDNKVPFVNYNKHISTTPAKTTDEHPISTINLLNENEDNIVLTKSFDIHNQKVEESKMNTVLDVSPKAAILIDTKDVDNVPVVQNDEDTNLIAVKPDQPLAGQNENEIIQEETVKQTKPADIQSSQVADNKNHSEMQVEDFLMKERQIEVNAFVDKVANKNKNDLMKLQHELEAEMTQLQKEKQKKTREAATVSSEMQKDVQVLLGLFGIPYVVSPQEAEAQCAALDLLNITNGSITDDSDVFLFGAKKVYKNVFDAKKYAEYHDAEEIENLLRLDRRGMIAISLLTGSDYTDGIQGVGGVTAIEILHEFGSDPIDSLMNFKIWFDESKTQKVAVPETKLKSKLRSVELPKSFPSHHVIEAYMQPLVDLSEEPCEWGKPDLGSLREFATDKLGWRTSKVDEILLPVMKRINKPLITLNRFTTVTLKKPVKAYSKRLQRIVTAQRFKNSEAGESTSKSELSKTKSFSTLPFNNKQRNVGGKKRGKQRNISTNLRHIPMPKEPRLQLSESSSDSN